MLFRDEYGFLSNFHPCKVTTALGTFQCSEAAFMAEKCPERASEFFNLNGAQAKKLGRDVPLINGWNDLRIEKMEMVLRAKFSCPVMMSKLKAVTGTIQEDNMWDDTFWGVCKGIGQNNLGKLLMMLRDEREDVGMNEQLQAAIALLVATGGMDNVVELLEREATYVIEFNEDIQDIHMEQNSATWDEHGQLQLPATAEMVIPAQKKFRGEVSPCSTGKITKVSLDAHVFFIPTALITARGLERAIIELKKSAQAGMKPRWDMLLKGFA